ncbi:synaptotagmin-2 [Denticeps clupeoides]|uniref:C2 domain-containing protein n=1 Tax=Denticeps clupeoides TaxID=299321 RepID=A0AAY4EXN6_9TELE|nr:synaptotagmin-2-like [Denticeps clupeoides]
MPTFSEALRLSIWDVRLPFPDEVKYVILAISILIVFIALAILIWQVCNYCSQTSQSKKKVSNSAAEGRNAKSRIFIADGQSPDLKEERPCEELGRLSRYLSADSSLSDLGGSLDSLLDQEEEKQVKGSLRFTLYYDRSESRLVVTVSEAQGLPLRDFSHSVDPFVMIRLLWSGGGERERSGVPLQCVIHEWQTRVVKDSSSPLFGDQFSCILEEKEVPYVTVRLEVQDYDKYSRHGILGEARTSLRGLKISYPTEILQDLQQPKKDLVGEVLISLKYLPTSHRLEVGLLKIRTISKFCKADRVLYARTYVLCNQSKLRHQNTTTKTRWEVTVFNEVMVFMLPSSQIMDCSVVVTVYEIRAEKKSTKHLIGRVAFGKNITSEDEHWSLMMHSLRQPIAKWHLMYV